MGVGSLGSAIERSNCARSLMCIPFHGWVALHRSLHQYALQSSDDVVSCPIAMEPTVDVAVYSGHGLVCSVLCRRQIVNALAAVIELIRGFVETFVGQGRTLPSPYIYPPDGATTIKRSGSTTPEPFKIWKGELINRLQGGLSNTNIAQLLRKRWRRGELSF
jgi:hypothetical protein